MIVRALRARATPRNLAILFAVVAPLALSFTLYFAPAYQAVSGGTKPFDMQSPLGADTLGIQLALLTPESLTAYTRFLAADYVFPPLAALFVALLWAALLNTLRAPGLDRMYAAGFWLVPFLAAGCDLYENALFYRIIAAAPQPLLDTIDTAVAVHRFKLAFLNALVVITAGLLAVAGFAWLRRKLVRADRRT